LDQPQASDGLDHLEPADRKVPENDYLVQFIGEPAKSDQNFHLTVSRDDVSGNYYVKTWSDWRGAENSTHPATESLAPLVKVELPVDIASNVYAMWVNALLEVRYDRLASPDSAGSTDLFSVSLKGRGWLHGAALNPTKDLPPKWMEDSAKALIQFTKDKDEAKLRRAQTDLRDKLFAYLGTNGRN
jgi:hypothetical protein